MIHHHFLILLLFLSCLFSNNASTSLATSATTTRIIASRTIIKRKTILHRPDNNNNDHYHHHVSFIRVQSCFISYDNKQTITTRRRNMMMMMMIRNDDDIRRNNNKVIISGEDHGEESLLLTSFWHTFWKNQNVFNIVQEFVNDVNHFNHSNNNHKPIYFPYDSQHDFDDSVVVSTTTNNIIIVNKEDYDNNNNKYESSMTFDLQNSNNINTKATSSTTTNVNMLLSETTMESYKSRYQQNKNKKKSIMLSFQLIVSYMGHSFCGWQRQQSRNEEQASILLNNQTILLLPSVQEVIEDTIQNYYISNESNVVDVRVSGRTDSGVHAIGQVARVRILSSSSIFSSTNSNDNHDDDKDDHDHDNSHMNSHIYEKKLRMILDKAALLKYQYQWRCQSVTMVSKQFHPTFDSISRSYIYFIDVYPLISSIMTFILKQNINNNNNNATTDTMNLSTKDLYDISIWIMNRLNHFYDPIINQTLDYISFSYGQIKTETTLCCIENIKANLWSYEHHDNHHMNSSKYDQKQASSSWFHSINNNNTSWYDDNYNIDDDQQLQHKRWVIAIELTGNRFLRRMVRILVATSLYHAVKPLLLLRNSPNISNMMNNETTTTATIIDTILQSIRITKNEHHDDPQNRQQQRPHPHDKHYDQSNKTGNDDVGVSDCNIDVDDNDNLILYKICSERNRRLACYAAPSNGLVFINATMKKEGSQ